MVILCCTLCLTITFSILASMSSAMVCMIDDSDTLGNNSQDIGRNLTSLNTTLDFFNSTAARGTKRNEWTFKLDKGKQGLVLTCFYVGYYISLLPSSLLSARFGPTRLVTVSLILISTFQVLAVSAAHYGVGWLYADRLIVGINVGFLYAPTFAIVGQWAPRFETSFLLGIAAMGMDTGSTLSYATSLLACEIDVQGGWPFVFYILSGLGFLTAILFIIFVSDSPFNNRLISAKEVRLIGATIPKLEKNSIKAMVNLLSGIPFLGIIPTIYIAGFVSDKLVANGIVSNTNVRKINDFISKIIPAIILIGLGSLPEGSTAAAFVLNMLGVTIYGFSNVSWVANPVDLAPAYTGFIVGFCEVGAVWISILEPIVFEAFTKHKSRSEWQLMFYITGAIQVVCFLFYAAFASGELQPWALSTNEYDGIHANDNSPDVKKFHNGLQAKLSSSDSNASSKSKPIIP